MRRVTVAADRSVLAFGHETPMHTLVINFLNLDMAFTTSLGDVSSVNRRITVHRSFDIVHSVAIVAGGRHNQTHLHQSPPVNALLVLIGSLGIPHPVFAGYSFVAVTVGAGLG